MAPVLDGLGEKLAEKWLTALAAPGLLFVGATATAAVLGHAHALDWSLLRRRVGHWATTAGHWPAGEQLAAAAVLVLAAVAVGTLVRTCGDGAVRIWTGDWPRPLRPLAHRLTARRARHWDDLQQDIDRLRTTRPARDRTTDVRQEIDALTVRRDHIALARPARPTYTGDRLAATVVRVDAQYGIDLAACWPRLWMVLPEDVRTELRTVRTRFDTAVMGSAWAACYAVLGCFWWPAAVAAAVTGFLARQRVPQAAAALAEHVESAVDVHLRRLAEEIGLTGPTDGPPDRRLGLALNRIARKAT
ncbi:hypothetical protein AB0L10_20690 [Streptomyces flaveolus]|uniref:hypothetical protein n=1 Tax=Streptomyces flaveolus TaxID=67297 RepID=UPI00342FB661